MKKLMMLSLGVMAVMSCSNNDDSEEQVSIVGVWKETKTVIYSGSNNAVLGTEMPDACDQKNTYDFGSNGVLTSSIFYTKSDGTCGIDGTFTDSYSYDPATKKITVAGDVSDVLSLTSSELQVVVDNSDENGDGINDKIVLFLYR